MLELAPEVLGGLRSRGSFGLPDFWSVSEDLSRCEEPGVGKRFNKRCWA